MSATLTAGIASLVLNIDQPVEADLVTPRDDLIGVKVWVDSSSDTFTPSETNLVFDGNSLSVTIPNLSFGTTYWVKYALISDIEPENYVISSALSGVPLESTYQEDTTPAPTPTGVTFTPAFSTIIVEHDAPTYTAGHGHSRSVLFGKIYTGGALPTFSQSTSIAEFTGRIHSFATTMGTTWRLWLVWVSNDGVASSVPYGGTNGIEVTTGKIGTTDLGPLIVEAGNLANGTVTASKLAAESITATKFANDIEPVSVVSSIPTSKSTSTVFNTADGKLYRWNGASYVASIPSSDISGQLADTQIAALSASKVTGQLSDTQLSAISAAKLTGTIVGTQITDGAISTEKLSAGAVTAAKIAADTITADNIAAGAITATELAAGAVVAGKIAAGTIQAGDIAAGTITGDKIAANTITSSQIAADTITAGNIAAGAIGASEIAAGAITAKHITITDYENLCFNGRGESLDGWYGGGVTSSASFPYWPSSIGASSALNFSTRDNYFGPNIPVKSGDSFFVSFDSIPFGGGTANYSFNIGFRFLNKDGNTITWAAGASRAASESGTQSSSGSVTAPENSAYAVIWVQIDKDGNNTSTASGDGFHVTNIRAQRKNAGSLIVDGAITASKIAANAIAVGTAAIENGAIVNAMIANAAIDDAKIANLNASKITAGTISADRIAAGSISADKIDSRGLSIKDANGNVILAAGTALDFANVGGDTKPAANANKTYVDSNGNIQGVSSGAGTEVSNASAESRLGRWQWLVNEYRTDSTINAYTTVPSYELVNRATLIKSIYAANTTTNFSFNDENYFGVASCSIYSPNAWTWSVTVGHDDAGRIYVNGQSVYSNQIGSYAVSLSIPAGWSTIELMWAEQVGGDYFTLSQALSARSEVTDMWAGADLSGVIAAASKTSIWTNVSGRPTSLSDLDSTASTALAGKLSKAGDTITGRITMDVADGIFAGSDTNNGVYMGNGGLVGKKNGTTTFAIDTAGNATFRGTVTGSDFITGGYSGYAWPPAGQSGCYLGPNGLLLGNANNGKYFQVTSDGNLYAPGFYIENGNATFSGSLTVGVVSAASFYAYTSSIQAIQLQNKSQYQYDITLTNNLNWTGGKLILATDLSAYNNALSSSIYWVWVRFAIYINNNLIKIVERGVSTKQAEFFGIHESLPIIIDNPSEILSNGSSNSVKVTVYGYFWNNSYVATTNTLSSYAYFDTKIKFLEVKA